MSVNGNKKRREDKLRIDGIIGNNIRNEREMRNLTREELADMLKLTVAHLGLMERGERGATSVSLEKISNIFNIPAGELFTECDSDKPRKDFIEDTKLTAGRAKIISLITRLDIHDIDFIIHVIKGIIRTTPSRGGLKDCPYKGLITSNA